MVGRIGIGLCLVAAAALIVAGCGGGSNNSGGSFTVGIEGGDFLVSGIILHFPPGAVATPTPVFVVPLAPLSANPLPVAAPAGLTAISAVQLEPETLLFPPTALVTMTLPLASARTANEQLTLYVVQGSAWVDSGRVAVVSSSGATAVTQIERFGVYALFVP
jgi:hypothetical protein